MALDGEDAVGRRRGGRENGGGWHWMRGVFVVWKCGGDEEDG